MKYKLIILFFVCFSISFLYPLRNISQLKEKNITTSLVEPNIELVALTTDSPIVEATIRYYADEYGLDVNIAIRIADCESKLGKYKFNFEGSSAKGVYQFTDRTWEHYCDGDVLNDEDNIICFMKLYEENKNWWECR